MNNRFGVNIAVNEYLNDDFKLNHSIRRTKIKTPHVVFSHRKLSIVVWEQTIYDAHRIMFSRWSSFLL